MNDRQAAIGDLTILAIDSSTEQAGLCLDQGGRLGELSWPAGRSQTVTLLGQVHALLELHGLTASDVGAIAVATGPGTFTGLRVGMSVAKGLVLGWGVPLVGVPTLAAAALPHAAAARPVVPVVAAGRGRLVWATYEGTFAAWRLVVPPRNGTVEELVAELTARPDEVIITGELDPAQAATLAASPRARLVPDALRGRRPAAFAALARQRLRRGEADNPVTLEPLYTGR